MHQNSEQLARAEIDRQMIACGWVIQNKKSFNLSGKAEEDGVLVPYNVFEIETKITKQEAKISFSELYVGSTLTCQLLLCLL